MKKTKIVLPNPGLLEGNGNNYSFFISWIIQNTQNLHGSFSSFLWKTLDFFPCKMDYFFHILRIILNTGTIPRLGLNY